MKSIHVRRLASQVTRTTARFVDLAAREQLQVADLPGAKLPWYAVRNLAEDEDDVATVFIFDEIGGSFGVDASTFARDLQDITASTIHVRINSPGGSVFDAIAIHSSLLHHPARIIAYVDSLAASAASVIAMAGDEVVMMPGSQMMIHDASAVEDGNAAEMAKMSVFLDRQSENIADMYRRRGGRDSAHWRELMLAETWMFAREAVEMGLADRAEDDDERDTDPELDELMTRSFDLGHFRYAGRREAPAPGQHAPTRRPRLAARATESATDRVGAAELRSRAAGRAPAARRSAPAGMSAARMAAFPAELRAELVDYRGQQRYHVTGHASVVDTPYEMWDDYGPYMEVIERGAFTKTLASNPDVAFLVNHRGVTMARTTNGSLALGMDDVGLSVEAWLNPKRQDVCDLVEAIRDRDITEMSFAFMLSDGGGRWSDGFAEFRISDLDMDRGDVSTVNYGANPYTDVAARSREILADLDHLPAGAARAALARLQHREALAPVTAPTSPAAPPPLDLEPGSGRSITQLDAWLATVVAGR